MLDGYVIVIVEEQQSSKRVTLKRGIRKAVVVCGKKCYIMESVGEKKLLKSTE